MIRVWCNKCGAAGYHDLANGPLLNPHTVVPASCICCLKPHDHAGVGCRPVTVELVPGSIGIHAQEN